MELSEAMFENIIDDLRWTSVDSSFIQAISVCEQSRIIGIKMRQDDYFYEVQNPVVDIISLYNSFLNSPSKGKFYGKVFKSGVFAKKLPF